jgi:hypothetical protein
LIQKQTYRSTETDIQIDTKTDIQIDRNRHTDRHKQTCRLVQTDMQTDVNGHTD